MNITQKLVLGYIVFIVFFCVVSYLGLQANEAVTQAFHEAGEQTIPTIEILEDLKFAGLRVVASAMEFSFLRAEKGELGQLNNGEGGEEEKNEGSEISEGIELLDLSMKRYEELVKRYPKEETGLVRKLEIQREELKERSAAFIQLTKERGVGPEILKAKEDLEGIERQFLGTLELILDRENEELSKRKETVILLQEFLRKITIITLVFVILGILLLGITILFPLMRDIKKLLRMSNSIGAGELGVRVHIEKKNELGALAVSFNNMAENLERNREQLERYTEELLHSNKELEQFAYIASHDLQEPLRKVKTFGGRLVQKYDKSIDEQGRDYLRRIDHAIDRMQTLINDLLTYSRVTSKARPFTNVNLNEVVREVLSDLEVKIEETKAQVITDNLPTIEADPVQMGQLFQNLISNALKFCKPNTPPVIEIRSTFESSLGGNPDKGSAMDERFCVMSVVDNGVGFEEKYKEQIFGVFQRLHGRNEYPGTGIGLAVCWKIVSRHGGTIKVNSTPGQGSTFIITLPLIQSGKENDK